MAGTSPAMTTNIAVQLFSAARCFRRELRREIFALAATICSARDGRFRDASLSTFASAPTDGISGKVGWIDTG